MKLSLKLPIFSKTPKDMHLYEHEFHVYRDWTITVIVTCIGIVTIAAVHIVLFSKVNSGTLFSFSPENKVVPTTIDRDQLQNVRKQQEERAARFDQIQNGQIAYPIDPAISS